MVELWEYLAGEGEKRRFSGLGGDGSGRGEVWGILVRLGRDVWALSIVLILSDFFFVFFCFEFFRRTVIVLFFY